MTLPHYTLTVAMFLNSFALHLMRLVPQYITNRCLVLQVCLSFLDYVSTLCQLTTVRLFTVGNAAGLRGSSTSGLDFHSFIFHSQHRTYRGSWGHSKPATSNPDMAAQLTGSLDPWIITTQRKISQLEALILTSADIQNFFI